MAINWALGLPRQHGIDAQQLAVQSALAQSRMAEEARSNRANEQFRRADLKFREDDAARRELDAALSDIGNLDLTKPENIAFANRRLAPFGLSTEQRILPEVAKPQAPDIGPAPVAPSPEELRSLQPPPPAAGALPTGGPVPPQIEAALDPNRFVTMLAERDKARREAKRQEQLATLPAQLEQHAYSEEMADWEARKAQADRTAAEQEQAYQGAVAERTERQRLQPNDFKVNPGAPDAIQRMFAGRGSLLFSDPATTMMNRRRDADEVVSRLEKAAGLAKNVGKAGDLADYYTKLMPKVRAMIMEGFDPAKAEAWGTEEAIRVYGIDANLLGREMGAAAATRSAGIRASAAGDKTHTNTDARSEFETRVGKKFVEADNAYRNATEALGYLKNGNYSGFRVAAGLLLKASGETKPSDADVRGITGGDVGTVEALAEWIGRQTDWNSVPAEKRERLREVITAMARDARKLGTQAEANYESLLGTLPGSKAWDPQSQDYFRSQKYLFDNASWKRGSKSAAQPGTVQRLTPEERAKRYEALGGGNGQK